MKIVSFLIILSLFIFSSCSLQKRIYTKGFYISNHQTSKKPKTATKEDNVASVSFISKIVPIKKAETQNTLLAQVSKSIKKDQRAKNESIEHIPYSFLTDACDTIVLKNGTKIAGAITDVKNNKVYFTNCGSANYFTSVINQTDVDHLIFMNGKTTEKLQQNHTKKTGSNLHIAGTILIVLGICVIFVPILLFGLLATLGATGGYSILIGLVLLIFGLGLVITSIVQGSVPNNLLQ